MNPQIADSWAHNVMALAAAPPRAVYDIRANLCPTCQCCRLICPMYRCCLALTAVASAVSLLAVARPLHSLANKKIEIYFRSLHSFRSFLPVLSRVASVLTECRGRHRLRANSRLVFERIWWVSRDSAVRRFCIDANSLCLPSKRRFRWKRTHTVIALELVSEM